MSHQFQYGARSNDNKMLQQKLRQLGFKIDDDGIFGTQTAIALQQFTHATGPVTTVDQDLFNALFPELQPKGEFMNLNIQSQWLSGLVASTAGKYVITMIATYIASKLGLDQGNVYAIIVQLIGVIMGVWGMAESAKSKIVVNGQKVNLTNASPSDQVAAQRIVANNKS